MIIEKNQILASAQQLAPQDQVWLIAELAAHLSTLPFTPQHSLLELKGLGAELWRTLPAQQYVNAERDSWDG